MFVLSLFFLHHRQESLKNPPGVHCRLVQDRIIVHVRPIFSYRCVPVDIPPYIYIYHIWSVQIIHVFTWHIHHSSVHNLYNVYMPDHVYVQRSSMRQLFCRWDTVREPVVRLDSGYSLWELRVNYTLVMSTRRLSTMNSAVLKKSIHPSCSSTDLSTWRRILFPLATMPIEYCM